jgi:diguanylate cyclase (GGDEF)-like protein
MLDLDGFKMVNDVLGHLRGDEVLREFSQILRELCREQDLPCRYAGDEFVVVLNAGADEAYVEAFTRRVRKALQERSRHWMSSSVQVSIGAAYAPKDGTEVRSLLAVADERMYSDKFMRRASLGLSREVVPEGAPVISGWGPPPGTGGE